MEQQDIIYNKAEYIETASGNKVSRQSVLCGSQNIVLNGKTIIMSDCIIRGDLANVRIGRHCIVGRRTVIRPPFKKFSKGGRRSVLKDCCAIADNTVLAPETVVPPFTLYSGSPGIFTSELPECTQDLMIDITKSYYQHFIPDLLQK